MSPHGKANATTTTIKPLVPLRQNPSDTLVMPIWRALLGRCLLCRLLSQVVFKNRLHSDIPCKRHKGHKGHKRCGTGTYTVSLTYP